MATTTRSASEWITAEVTSWPGVRAVQGDRGELSFRLGRRELGHLHGDRALHVGFTKAIWHDLHAQGRIDYHPVFPGRPGHAARRLASDGDVRDAIALLRLNYDRAVARGASGGPAATAGTAANASHTGLPSLHSSAPETLPFAPNHEIRAFLLEREHGNVLLYSVTGLDAGADWVRDRGGAARHYLGHRHEAMFAPAAGGPPLYVHERDRAGVEKEVRVRAAFSRRHTLDGDLEAIPIPGHTPGATAYLWDSGRRRLLFTGDTIHLDGDDWIAAVLASSDREEYVRSLELLREVEFDVLVPWVASRGGPFLARTDAADARRRIDAILTRIGRGEAR